MKINAAMIGLGLLEPSVMGMNSDKTVSLKELKVTLGTVRETRSGFLTVVGPKERAQLRLGLHSRAKLQFRYREASAQTEPLRSGAVVRQIGLKLRTKNTCNLLYVMWRIEPAEQIRVSIKENPGQSTHEECENRGYHTITELPLTGLKITASDHKAHTLEAMLRPHEKAFPLTIMVDDRKLWEGQIDDDLLKEIDGPAGFRTDNGSFIFKFFAS